MHLEQLTLTNFRCFGPEPETVAFSPTLTAFVGVNGVGKTATMQALQRLFGVTGGQRAVSRRDFHVPADDDGSARQRSLSLDAVLAFPELDEDPQSDVIPQFFQQMAAHEDGHLKCRLRLDATWTDDGSLEGDIEVSYCAVRTFGDIGEDDRTDLRPVDRGRIQLVYVPASRDGASQMAAFLRGRLWRAIQWSEGLQTSFSDLGTQLNEAFEQEDAVQLITENVERRWREVHSGGTDARPRLRPFDSRFHEFARNAQVVFSPGDDQRDRALDELSDGQRSLFHLAMTATTLDVEASISDDAAAAGFQPDGVPLPALTLVAIEEPENNLAPYYLSRIVRQLLDLTSGPRVQALASSHSASILTRVEPSAVRHFRLGEDRTAQVRTIRLPDGDEAASKYVREAVRAYPELYFARFAVLGEGASEEVVLPRLAEALGLDVDPSFVAVVPLGGRHVNHLWRLLSDLDIPHATLLDLDWGRNGGGWGRIKTTCEQLLAVDTDADELFHSAPPPPTPIEDPADFVDQPPDDFTGIEAWVHRLRRFGVFFSSPLDLDYSMLRAFYDQYSAPEPGRAGPNAGDARGTVLGAQGQGTYYGGEHDDALLWYRYLFINRGKPSTHVRVMSQLDPADLAAGAPEELAALLSYVAAGVEAPGGDA